LLSFIFFLILLSFLFAVLIISGVYSNNQKNRVTFGWWAGIVLSLILLGASAQFFEPLPEKIHYRYIACVNKYVEDHRTTDWGKVCENATQINWYSLLIGFFVGFSALDILMRLNFSEKQIAMLMFLLSLSSSYLFIYIFTIRKLTYIFFSFFLGIIFSSFVYFAFFSDDDNKILNFFFLDNNNKEKSNSDSVS